MDKIKMVEKLLKDKFPDAILETFDMAGDPTNLHLGLSIASDAFIGKSILQQHRLVMDVLKQSLQAEVHAVKIKTMTLEKYNQK